MHYVESGNSKTRTVMIFGISLKTIWNWIKKKKEGNLAPKKRLSSSRKINKELLLNTSILIQKHT